MKYFVTGSRYDSGYDDGYEHQDETFDSKEETEQFILSLLTRKNKPFKASDFSIIYGKIVTFDTEETVIAKVTLKEAKT